MAITASSGTTTSSGITVSRPSWNDMYENYPNESIPSSEFYSMVSKELVELVKRAPDDWENTCAARMSYALNRSGIKLPSTGGYSLKGEDGFRYWMRVKELKDYMSKRFSNPDISYNPKQIQNITENRRSKLKDEMIEKVNLVQSEFLPKISNKKGIIVFDVVGWGNASGHFTLWDGKDLVYVGPGDHNNPDSPEYYFWYTSEGQNGRVIQTKKISFWELK